MVGKGIDPTDFGTCEDLCIAFGVDNAMIDALEAARIRRIRREAGKKGGQATSAKGSAHMARIGTNGGNSTVDAHGAEHMARIGRNGGKARRKANG